MRERPLHKAEGEDRSLSVEQLAGTIKLLAAMITSLRR